MPRAKNGVKTTVRKARQTQQTVEVRKKQERALQLRMSGATFLQIAEALGYANPSGAAAAVKSAMDRIGREPAADLLHMELSRLDQMQQIAWKELIQGDTSQINNILRIMDKRHRLTGLEQHIDATVNNTQVNISVDGKGVSVNSQTGVMVIDGDENAYVAALAALKGFSPEEAASLQPSDEEDPKPIAAIEAGSGDGDTFEIVDAEIVYDTSADEEEDNDGDTDGD